MALGLGAVPPTAVAIGPIPVVQLAVGEVVIWAAGPQNWSTVGPLTIDVVADAPAPAVTTGVTVAAPPVEASASVEFPDRVSAGGVMLVGAQPMEASAVAFAPQVTFGVTVSPAPVEVQAVGPAPEIDVRRLVRVEVPAVAAEGRMLHPLSIVPATVTVPIVEATAEMPSPRGAMGTAAQAPAITATSDMPTPAVTAGVSVVVESPAMEAAATAPAPAVTVVQPSAPVVFDAAGSQNGGNGGSVRTLTWNHQVGAQDACVIVAVTANQSRTATVTCGGVPMTLIGSANNGTASYVMMFALLGVAPGARQIVATLSANTNRAQAVSTSYTKVLTIGAPVTATGATAYPTVSPAAVTTPDNRYFRYVIGAVTDKQTAVTDSATVRVEASSDGGDQLGGKAAIADATVTPLRYMVMAGWGSPQAATWAAVGFSLTS